MCRDMVGPGIGVPGSQGRLTQAWDSETDQTLFHLFFREQKEKKGRGKSIFILELGKAREYKQDLSWRGLPQRAPGKRNYVVTAQFLPQF